MKNLNVEKIVKVIEKNKKEILKLGVKKIGIFGSFTKRKESIKSDIDILVVFDRVSFDQYMELKFMLEKRFRRKVDLVIEESLKPRLKYVKKEAKYARL
jgi:hypothetical protein